MKKSVMVLFCTISTILVLGSIHSIFADELVRTEIDVLYVNTTAEDSKYKIHVHVEVRNSDNQLITVTESTHSMYLDHEITDKAFDTMLGERETVTIDNIKYEKIQFGNSIKAMDYGSVLLGGLWIAQTCDPSLIELGSECINFLQSRTHQLIFEDDDVITVEWVVLRVVD